MAIPHERLKLKEAEQIQKLEATRLERLEFDSLQGGHSNMWSSNDMTTATIQSLDIVYGMALDPNGLIPVRYDPETGRSYTSGSDPA